IIARTLGLTSPVDDPRKRAKSELLRKAKTCQQTSELLALWDSRRPSTTQENVRRVNCCAKPKLARTLGLTSPVDDPRKRAKSELLRKAKTCQQTFESLALWDSRRPSTTQGKTCEQGAGDVRPASERPDPEETFLG
ncbi:hypothetical protein PanWU01x14_049170, partial [Parasponia andersonii]